MNAIVKAWNENVADTSNDQLRAHCLKQLDQCLQLLRQFERPEYRSYVEFALIWGAMERKLKEVQRLTNECTQSKTVGSFGELFEQLTAKTKSSSM